MAPLTRRRKKALALAAAPAPPPATIDPADRLSRLPEELQAQILSLLPAPEAVRMCVLARAWRDVWKLTRRLLVTGESVREVRDFVDSLLRARLDGELDAFDVRMDPLPEGQDAENYEFLINPYLDAEDRSSLIRWIRHVLECQIQTLRIDISTFWYIAAYLKMSDNWLPLVSRHLTRLELRGIWFDSVCLDLDGYPALEYLEINECWLDNISKMTSLSLKRLVITSCFSYGDRERIQICVPRLVSLWLETEPFRVPQLERMPELVGAKVKITSCLDYHDVQADSDSDVEEDSYRRRFHGANITKCVVLEGLAQARDLVLLAHNSTFIFRRDLRWCPTFSNLKTLVLNDYWCKSADCSALACMLEHAPVLQKLTVLFSGEETEDSDLLKYDVVVEGRPNATGKSTMISQHLKIVEVKCFEVHQRVVNVLKFLGTFNIWFQVRVTEGSKGKKKKQ